MKRFFGLLIAVSLCGTAARAQSTMPAMGANTPSGQVAKTDASVNSTNVDRGTADKNDRSMKDKKMPAKHSRNKMKMKGQTQTTM